MVIVITINYINMFVAYVRHVSSTVGKNVYCVQKKAVEHNNEKV